MRKKVDWFPLTLPFLLITLATKELRHKNKRTLLYIYLYRGKSLCVIQNTQQYATSQWFGSTPRNVKQRLWLALSIFYLNDCSHLPHVIGLCHAGPRFMGSWSEMTLHRFIIKGRSYSEANSGSVWRDSGGKLSLLKIARDLLMVSLIENWTLLVFCFLPRSLRPFLLY